MVLCRRLADRGYCKYGCTRQQTVCHFHLKSWCKYGNNCRNLHLTKGAGKGTGKEGASHRATDTEIAEDRDLLGIEDPATMDEAVVNERFRRLSKLVHPDKVSKDPQSQRDACTIFRGLTRARDRLLALVRGR